MLGTGGKQVTQRHLWCAYLNFWLENFSCQCSSRVLATSITDWSPYFSCQPVTWANLNFWAGSYRRPGKFCCQGIFCFCKIYFFMILTHFYENTFANSWLSHPPPSWPFLAFDLPRDCTIAALLILSLIILALSNHLSAYSNWWG